MLFAKTTFLKDSNPSGWSLALWSGSPVGLEVEGGIEAIDLGVAVAFGGKVLHLHQIEAIEAVLVSELAPEGSGGEGIRQS